MPDSCVLVTDAPVAAAAGDPHIAEGALALAVVLDQQTVLLSGWMSAPPPERAVVQVGGGGEPGTWHATTWTAAANPGVRQVLAVLRAENVVRTQALPLTLHGPDGARLALPPIARVELEAAPLLEQLRSAGADLAAAFGFIKRSLTEDEGTQPASPRVASFLLAFLGAVSVHDGFIEIVGRPDCGGLLLQGWSVHLEAGMADFGCLSSELEMFEAAVACFERPDLLSTARGLIAFIKDAGKVELNGLTRVYFTSRGTYYHLDVVEKRLVLEEQATAHLKDMLSRLQGPAGAVRMLKRVCRPRFPGHETVSSLNQPVRLAQDVVLHAPGGGVFVSGWLLDPRHSVHMVLLKSTRNFYARLDPTWVRLPRPDVTTGFSSDPLFAEWLRPWENQHGFVAFVPRPQPIVADEIHYLEIVLEDESCIFLPLKFSDGDPQALLRQILGAVSIDDPAIDHIVGTHLGPLVSALCADSRAVVSASSTPFGRAPETPRVSAIVPLSTGWADFDINLARFAADPDFRDVELVVVAPRTEGNRIAQALRKYAPFYDMGGTLVLSDEPLDYASALDAGAKCARAELILFLSPSVFPCERGWLGTLIAALQAAPDAAAASPTLLYEDDSVRYAGIDSMPDPEEGTVCDRFRGYGHHWLQGEQSRPVSVGTGECCLVRKQVFAALGGFSHEFLCSDLRSRDFGLRLQAAGGKLYWVPSLRLYALDDESGEPQDYWMRVRRLVDRWGFARKWAQAATPATPEK